MEPTNDEANLPEETEEAPVFVRSLNVGHAHSHPPLQGAVSRFFNSLDADEIFCYDTAVVVRLLDRCHRAPLWSCISTIPGSEQRCWVSYCQAAWCCPHCDESGNLVLRSRLCARRQFPLAFLWMVLPQIVISEARYFHKAPGHGPVAVKVRNDSYVYAAGGAANSALSFTGGNHLPITWTWSVLFVFSLWLNRPRHAIPWKWGHEHHNSVSASDTSVLWYVWPNGLCTLVQSKNGAGTNSWAQQMGLQFKQRKSMVLLDNVMWYTNWTSEKVTLSLDVENVVCEFSAFMSFPLADPSGKKRL